MKINSNLLILFNGFENKVLKSRKFNNLIKGQKSIDIIGFPELKIPIIFIKQIQNEFDIVVNQVEIDEKSNSFNKANQRAYKDFNNDYKKHKLFNKLISFNWLKMISNDRHFYRILPIFDFEEKIKLYLKENKIYSLIIPYLGTKFLMSERLSFLGWGLGGFALTNIIHSLQRKHKFKINYLFPRHVFLERLFILFLPTLIFCKRLIVRVNRSSYFIKKKNKTFFSSKKRNVLFLIQGAPQKDSLEPLYNYMKNDINTHIIVRDIVASSPAENLLNKEQNDFLTLDSFFTKFETFLCMFKNLFKQMKVQRKINYFLKTKQINEIQRQKFISDSASIYFLGFFMDQLDRAIKVLDIDIIISANNVESTMGAISHSAKKKKIKHVCIHNTAFERVDMPNYLDCDVYCADSDNYKSFLESKTTRKKIVSLGLPAYDKIYYQINDIPVVKKQNDMFVIGILTQADFTDFNQIILTLNKIQNISNWFFVSIRRHPREDLAVHQKAIDTIMLNHNAELDKSNLLIGFIQKCDLVISTTSTSLFWSILYNVPILSILPFGLREFANTIPYLDRSIAFRIDSELDLYDLLLDKSTVHKKLRHWKKSREKFLKNHASGFDGKACERIFNDLVLRLI